MSKSEQINGIDMDGEAVVVSGISGRFPNADNVKEFEYNLYNKIDMTDEDESRWKHFHPEVPARTGKIRNLEKFDASFFSILNKHANWMDPQCRCLLEHAYEAIIDAGISPQSLVGSRTGVFIGCCFSDSRDVFFYKTPVKEGYGVFGNANFYLSNRLSYALGLCGPSFTVDTACSSSAYALDCAYKYIMSGACDSAIVGGSQLVLNLTSTVEYSRLRILAPDGEFCRPFDENATGFTRADTISVIFLQRQKDSKRVYAQLMHTNSNNDGFKKEGSSFPSRVMQQKLMEDFFKQSKIDPSLIDFVEAHSTGTRLGDPEEVAAIDEVFCKNKHRKKPLPIGSVKSNMGHAEASSGVASIAKILLAFENKKIAPNINVTNMRKDIPSFAEGRIRVVTEVEDLAGPYISMNSFGLGGANAHCLFKGNLKEKVNHGIPSDDLGRMVLWSGRTEEALNTIFDDILQRPLDAEYIALLQNSQIQTNFANIYRGYGIFKHDPTTQKAICIQRDIQHFNGEKRPIVWVYSGIGSQWAEMGTDLMNIPIFAETINKCHNLLAPKGINLKHIITSPDKSLFNNVLNSYVGIVSIEIALTNILKAIGIVPDYIIGHSVGEMGCAYGDGCWTAEETILAAYARGVASCESKTIDGAMAAVGLNFREVEKSLPSTIDIACHNGADSTTISGPANAVREYVKQLKEKNIFAKEVESSGCPLHSRYITKMGENLLRRLSEVIKNPKKRSEKWLSSSFPQSEWNHINGESQFSSAAYHTKNLLNPVLFEEVTEMLPKNALTIEIAPCGLLRSILKRSMKEGVQLSITQRDSKNGAQILIEALGKLFQNGVDMDIGKIYPEIQFPVSRGTPMISPIYKWNHQDNYFVPLFDSFNSYERRNMLINVSDKNFEFVQGHIIDGKVLFPGTGWLYLVWETFAMMNGIHHSKLKVIFEDVKFLRATSLAKNQDVLVTISIHRGTGRFEIIEGRSAIGNGYIKIGENVEMTHIDVEEKNDAVILQEPDFYKEMRLRGYYHQGLFRAIKEIRDDGLQGKIKWNSEWVTFMDCLIQFQVVMKDTRMLILPTSVRKMIIDPIKHQKVLDSAKTDEILFDVKSCPYMHVIQSGGVEIHGFEGSLVNRRRPPSDPVLESYRFIPYKSNEIFSKRNAAKICVQIALENTPSKKLSSVEIDDGKTNEIMSEYIFKGLGDLPLITPEVNYLTSKDVELENVSVQKTEFSSFSNVNIIIKSNCTNDSAFIDSIKTVLNENGLIISKEQTTSNAVINDKLQLIGEIKTDDCLLKLLKFKKQIEKPEKIIKITPNINEWLEPLKQSLSSNSVIAYSQNDDMSGIIGLINCIRKEPNGEKFRCFFIDDNAAPKFDINDSFYKNQLDLGLIMNVYKNKQWGSYRHLELTEQTQLKPRKEHCFANCIIKGDLSTLTWLHGPLNPENSNKEIINISYASLNFRDVMLATGKINSDDVLDRIQQQCVFGFEFSGTTNNGRKVMGLGPTGAMATQYDANRTLLWDVPKNWSLEEAATVPLVYYTVYLAFFKTASIKKGNSILIHAGSGGVGMAAIQVALAYDLEVYTTVGSTEKRNYLLSRFPKLKAENIGNSRDTSFERLITVRTKGKGVDYVLNSLSDDKLQASIRCLGMNGTFLEIGKFDIMNKTNIHMGHLSKRVNFKAVFFDDVPVISEELKIVQDLVTKDINAGIIKPLKTTVFEASEIEQAFRFMGSGKHIGKVLLKMRNNPDDIESLPIKLNPRVYCDAEETYVLVGGLGGFGLELADWLILRGCRKLLISSGRGITNAYQASRIKIWKSYGVDVRITTEDVTTEKGCEKLLIDAVKIGPVGGIFNLAVALRDGIFENQTTQMFMESLAPKANATQYLDKLSRKLCPNLKHFVIFSSVSCGRGNAGQTNYGMGNSIMERICEIRHKIGLPAKAVQWGAIGDVGLLAVLQENNMDMEISGTLPQRINSCLEVLDTLLNSSEPIVASMVVAEKRFEDIKKGNIIEAIMNIMAIRDRKQISMEASLSKLGMDSLMGVEIQQILERDYDIVLSSQELRSLTMGQLEKLVTSKDSSDSGDKKAVNGDASLGIELLLTSFGDEKQSNETILKLNKVTSGNNKKVLIVPGFEGQASDIWINLAENLKYPTYALQLGNTVEEKSLDDIYEKVSKHILNLFSGKEEFILIGYSFGSMLALKIASLLESKGLNGNVVIIDGSPKFINDISNQLMPKDYNEEHIQGLIILGCVKLLFPDKAQEITKKIFASDSLDERFQIFLDTAKSRSEYSVEYGRKMITGLFNRFKICLSANKISYPILKSNVSFIKATQSPLSSIEEDYGLKKYVNKDMSVTAINGDHVSILSSPELIKLLNSHH
ncbi:hypothetical protein PVAND_005439 [Polypedilum vanderplanki]|uniref:Uncharacterized protein n=1 Tax=Polypedilum vanderplanki TaxID=319348 RepID=A0A9J6C0G4_POLVA|nr:hypothetical protein PVAND_005439 [Polypedilum vanderplanki]